MDEVKHSVFLLGGYDLEMHTIRRLLDERRITYYDHRLRWDNACLSQYREELQRYGKADSLWRIYGIELREDISVPSNYIQIDHHGQKATLPSALEQVLAILHLPLDRISSLIAANDKAYIPGMQALGATAEEIADIRRADREAQGVTREDEQLAEFAIVTNREDVGDLVVIRALSSRFSPICDRLFPYRRLLIYTDQEWMYYGAEMTRVKDLFEGDVSRGSLFYGGGKDGYLGTSQGKYSPIEIRRMVEQIKRYIA